MATRDLRVRTLLFMLGALCCINAVSSTHFRGGIIMVRPQPGGTEYEMEISYHVSWRGDRGGIGTCSTSTIESRRLLRGDGSLVCQVGCSRRISFTYMSFICTDFSLSENWSFGGRRLSYNFARQADQTITIGTSGQNWISPFDSRWNLPTTFSLVRRNDTGRINSSPRAITAPVIRLQEGCNHTLSLAVSDPDGDDVRCRWAVGDECGGICDGFPGAILDPSSCTFTYEANRGPGYQAAGIVLEDFMPGSLQPLSTVALQFLVLVVSSLDSCSQQPAIIPPTINNGACIAIPSGTTFTTQLVAYSGDPSFTISEYQTTSPIGLHREELQRVPNTDNYLVNITWTPQQNQENQTHLFCYTAANSGGLSSEQNCIQFLVGYFPPEPISNSTLPNKALVHPFNTTWTIAFDMEIVQPSTVAFITFYSFDTNQELYKINAVLSADIVFSGDNQISISPSFRFPEKANYYITLDRGVVRGLEGCGPGNEPINDKNFWTFETLDITPPVVTFIENPARSNANITISWKSNEIVSWICNLELNNQPSVVNCSEANWNGHNLVEGSYQLHISATDLAGNVATASHTFEIDLTPPLTSINQRPALISNQQTASFTFTCNEMCSFECQVKEINTIREEFIPCNQRSFTTPTLQHNTTYVFFVVATDDVGNRGLEVSYTWETDFENPQISSISNVTVHCTDTSPEVTGTPTAVDNRPEEVSVTYRDNDLGCYIQRTWIARDIAGNTDSVVQSIHLQSPVDIHLLPTIDVSCDYVSDSAQYTVPPPSVPNPCQLSLQLDFMDSVSELTCTSEFSRNWTARVCGKSVSVSQDIFLYESCQTDSCGRSESPPRGVCSFGECTCNRPWYSSDCSVQIFEPIVDQINDTILREAEEYVLAIPLKQGTPPLSWTLVSSPSQLRLDPYMQQIRWTRAQAGNHTISLRVENEVGVFDITWELEVHPGYRAFLDTISTNTFPHAEPVALTGRVEYFHDNLVQDILAGVVPVSIDISSGESTRTITAFTNREGTFSVVFYPATTEYGTYRAEARHPQSSPEAYQTEWFFLGMRAIPSSISLIGETVGHFQKSYANATIICNDGPGDLTRLNTTTNFVDSDLLQVDITLQELSLSNMFVRGDCISVDIMITANGPLRGLFLFSVEASEGTTVSALVNLDIQQSYPSFVVNPPHVSSRIIRGRSTVFEFEVTNVGKATAHNVQPILPPTAIFSFVSFGNDRSSYGTGDFELTSGESASLSIQAMIDDSHQLGEISASFYVTSDETFQEIPVSLTVSSDTLMNLTVVVEDEYTYFASGEPLVNDAVVTLINYQRDIRTAVSTEERNGSALFVKIYEDRYEMFIEAPGHRSLRQVIVTSIENPSVTVFLERQAVTYTWSVTPVTFQDTYVLTLEADFETEVPIPVVTVTPTDIDLEKLELGNTNSFQLNITNHGLIRANNVNIDLPNNHPFLEFSINNDVLGDLQALSSVTAIVRVSRRRIEKRFASTFVCWTIYAIRVAYSYICNDEKHRDAPVFMRKSKPCAVENPSNPRLFECNNCDGGSYPATAYSNLGDPTAGGGCYRCGISASLGNPGLNPTLSPPQRFSFNGFSAPPVRLCNPCLQSFLQCVPFPSGVPVVGCIPMILAGAQLKGVKDAIRWIGCGTGLPWIQKGVCVYDTGATIVQEVTSDNPRVYDLSKSGLKAVNCIKGNAYVDGGLCIDDALDNCLFRNSRGSTRRRRNLKSTITNILEGMYPIDLSLSVAVEILGDYIWLSVGDPQWLSQVLEPVLDDSSEDGVFVSASELSTIVAVPPPNGTTTRDVQRMVERVNNTLSGWNSGQLERTDDTNMASYNTVKYLTDRIIAYNEIAIGKGFTSYLDAYSFSSNDAHQLSEWEVEEGGVCAVVRIRIEQELAVTREAFLAKLEIENKEESVLEELYLEIIIIDSGNGESSTHLFSISNETLSGSLVRAGNAWTLMSGESGAVEWLIVPYSEAAPDSDRIYTVGGTLRYSFDNENITIPLLPTLITVTPDPSLLVHYFWEKNIIGDDPFTDEREPSVPFTLGVLVKNAGYGTASSLTLSSGQPEIIENEKGLLINFMIIGANIGSGSITPSLSLTLGDLSPYTTVVVRWFMISSLQGEFKNYSATFQNINPLGDPKLSILDELEIHELIRNVRIYVGTIDDQILDFLVNERKDINSYPDALYDSETLNRYNVSRGEVISVLPISDTTSSLEVRTVSNNSGWTYYRYEDTESLLVQAALTLNTTKHYDNEDVVIPTENSWVTRDVDRTRNTEKLILHILDFVEAGEVTFLVLPCLVNCTPTAVPYIVPTDTLPSSMPPTSTSPSSTSPSTVTSTTTDVNIYSSPVSTTVVMDTSKILMTTTTSIALSTTSFPSAVIASTSNSVKSTVIVDATTLPSVTTMTSEGNVSTTDSGCTPLVASFWLIGALLLI